MYCVRDAIAVSQEAVLAAVINEVTAGPEDGRSGMERSKVVAELLERVEEHNAPLRDLGLIKASESVADLTIRQLVARVAALVSAGQQEERGICRWSSGLTEPNLYNLAFVPEPVRCLSPSWPGLSPPYALAQECGKHTRLRKSLISGVASSGLARSDPARNGASPARRPTR